MATFAQKDSPSEASTLADYRSEASSLEDGSEASSSDEENDSPKRPRVPVESCGNVQLQWYVDYDGLREKGVNVDAAKYNSGNGQTLANLEEEIKANEDLLEDLCRETGLEKELQKPSNYKIVLICRNTDNGEIYGFALMSVERKKPKVVERFVDSPNALRIHFFCGHTYVCGVGKKMMDSIKEFCASNGLFSISLFPLDEKAKQFYKREGYEMLGNESPYKGDMKFNVTVFASDMIPVARLRNVSLKYATKTRNIEINMQRYEIADYDFWAQRILFILLNQFQFNYDVNAKKPVLRTMLDNEGNNVLFLCFNYDNFSDDNMPELLGALVLEIIPINKDANGCKIRMISTSLWVSGVEDLLVREAKQFAADNDLFEISTAEFRLSNDNYSRIGVPNPITKDFWKSHGFLPTSGKTFVWTVERTASDIEDDDEDEDDNPPATKKLKPNAGGSRGTRRRRKRTPKRRVRVASVRRRRTIRRRSRRLRHAR